MYAHRSDLDFDTYLWKTRNCASCTRHKKVHRTRMPYAKSNSIKCVRIYLLRRAVRYVCASRNLQSSLYSIARGICFFFSRSFCSFVFFFSPNSEHATFSVGRSETIDDGRFRNVFLTDSRARTRSNTTLPVWFSATGDVTFLFCARDVIFRVEFPVPYRRNVSCPVSVFLFTPSQSRVTRPRFKRRTARA